MKNYTITVNGIAYEVSVEENTGTIQETVVAKAPTPVAPAAPAPQAPKAKAPAPAPSGAKGSLTVESPMPGKILSVSVTVGQSVNKGDVLMVLEAMKMENEIVAAEAGTIASIDVASGEMVEAGTVLATLN